MAKRLVIALVLLASARAHAEPLWWGSPLRCETYKGDKIVLDPGYYLPMDEWFALDEELKRLQTAETRLSAENKELRKPTAQWEVIAGALALGALGGYILK